MDKKKIYDLALIFHIICLLVFGLAAIINYNRFAFGLFILHPFLIYWNRAIRYELFK